MKKITRRGFLKTIIFYSLTFIIMKLKPANKTTNLKEAYFYKRV